MKYTLKILLIVGLYFHVVEAHAQQKIDLVGNYYENYRHTEVLLELETFHDPILMINTLIIEVPSTSPFQSDSSNLFIDKIIIEYVVSKNDTIIKSGGGDSLELKKDSPFVITSNSRPLILFKDIKTGKTELHQNLTNCPNVKGSKYKIYLENHSEKKLNYTLYYIKDCGTNPNSEKLISSGFIRLKKYKKNKPYIIYS